MSHLCGQVSFCDLAKMKNRRAFRQMHNSKRHSEVVINLEPKSTGSENMSQGEKSHGMWGHRVGTVKTYWAKSERQGKQSKH